MDMAPAAGTPQTVVDLKEYLLDCGACTVGVADLSGLAASGTRGYPRAISIGVALRPDPILRLRQVGERPAEADRPARAALEALAEIAVEHLRRLGARAEVFRPGESPDDLTDEDIAVRAGVAWIGKSGRAVTWDYGSAVRLISVLTDAPLPPDRPVERSFCGTCLMCTMNCAAHAPSGTLWTPGLRRAQLVNEAACKARREQLLAEGRDCRYCMSVCPFTVVYLVNCGLQVPGDSEAEG